ncbi:MAG TPA: hypothetical protein VJ776_08930, partial [Thermoanaerobaculia bacterium]|nr:hypothetical protein [Thermoanaerobaculia bacterium]
MTLSFDWKVGGAGGGAARTTTERATIAAGGRDPAATPVRPATRSELVVGITGIGPRSTGAEATWPTTARSR